MKVDLLNKYVLESGIKKGVIARKMGITYETLRNKLDGTSELPVSKAILLADIIGMDRDVFFEVFRP